jgi:hypothetical protein
LHFSSYEAAAKDRKLAGTVSIEAFRAGHATRHVPAEGLLYHGVAPLSIIRRSRRDESQNGTYRFALIANLEIPLFRYCGSSVR